MITTPRSAVNPNLQINAKVSSKPTLQTLAIAVVFCFIFALGLLLLRKWSPSTFLIMLLPLVSLIIVGFMVALRCGQSFFSKTWVGFSSSGIEDYGSLLRLGHIPLRELHSVKWVRVLKWRFLRIRLNQDASVFKDWDEPKGVFVDVYKFLLGPKLLIPDFLIENSRDITNDWARAYTEGIDELKSKLKVEQPPTGSSLRMKHNHSSDSLALKYKFAIEQDRQASKEQPVASEPVVNLEPESGEDTVALGGPPPLDSTAISETNMNYLYGFTQWIRPLAERFDEESFGGLLQSFDRSDSSMTQEISRLKLADGNDVEFIVRYDSGADQSLFDIIWNGELVYSQQVELEIGALGPGPVITISDGPWQPQISQLFQQLERLIPAS